jgi:hypothetical protein
MNDEVYRCLDYEEIITKDHYFWGIGLKLNLLNPNSSYVGLRVFDSKKSFYEKLSLKDFDFLSDETIITEGHYWIFRCSLSGYLMIQEVKIFFHDELNQTAGSLRKFYNSSSMNEYNLCKKR